MKPGFGQCVVMLCACLCLAVSLLACGGKNDGTDDTQKTQAQMTWQEQYDLGIRLLNEGNYEDAILAFQAALSIDPKNMEARVGLANVYQQMGKTDLALQTLAEANPQASGLAAAYIQLAESYFRAGEEENALRVLQQALDRLDGGARDEVREYAEKKGYVVDESGRLIQFDEEAYLATLTKDEIWRYYFAKGENAKHWVFGDTIQLNGRDVETITLQDFEEIAAENGWEYSELEYRTAGENEEYSYVYGWSYLTEPYSIVFKASHSKTFLAEGYHCFQMFDLGYSGIAKEGTSVGVLDIRLGDSIETVLAKLGWIYVEKIGAILRQPQGTAIDEETYIDSEDMESPFVDVASPEKDTLQPGDKGSETIVFSYWKNGDEWILDLDVWLNEAAEGNSYQKISFQFDGDEFTLIGMNIHIG